MPLVEHLQGIAVPATDGNYAILKQPDGNYKGTTWKYGKEVQIRDIDPQTVLLRLMTQD